MALNSVHCVGFTVRKLSRGVRRYSLYPRFSPFFLIYFRSFSHCFGLTLSDICTLVYIQIIASYLMVDAAMKSQAKCRITSEVLQSDDSVVIVYARIIRCCSEAVWPGRKHGRLEVGAGRAPARGH